eukprot:EG_transcript_24751
MPDHVLIVHHGKTHDFPVALQCTVGDLKELVAARLFEDRAKENIRIVFRGKLWSDDDSVLADIGVENGSKVMVVAGRAPGMAGPQGEPARGQQWGARLTAWAAAILAVRPLWGLRAAVTGGPALAYDFVRTMFTDDGRVEGPAAARVGVAVPGPHDRPGRSAGGPAARRVGCGCNPGQLRGGH